MEKKLKGQVSIEMLAIVGVIVLGAIIFASYYLSSINKNMSQIEGLDTDFSEFLPDDSSGSFPLLPGIGEGSGSPFCGNNIINPPEQCDGTASFIHTCSSLGFGTGNLTCNPNCTFNASNCSNLTIACGNNILNSNEQCEMNNLIDPPSPMYNGNPSCTAYCIENGLGMIGTGDISCNANTCGIDYSACVCSNTPFSTFALLLAESNGSANPNVDYPVSLAVDFDPSDGAGLSEWVDVNVTVKEYDSIFKEFFITNKCKFNNVPIPANKTGLFVKRYVPSESRIFYSYNVSCSENGVYEFTFSGIDNSNHPSIKDPVFSLTIPLQDNTIFALCSSQTNSFGLFDVCVNRFNGSASSGDGSVVFFINQPDISEIYSTSPVCASSTAGSICFSLGAN